MGFEIKIIYVKKENNIYAQKTYKYHYKGKYESKKKLNFTEN